MTINKLKEYMCDILDEDIKERIQEFFNIPTKGFNVRSFETYLILNVNNATSEENIKELTKMIDDIFRFMLGKYENKISIGSFDFRNPVDENNIEFCNNDKKFITKSSLGEGNTLNNKLLIQEDTICNKEKGYYKFFDLILKENKTDLEKRIVNSLNWLGQANNSIYLPNSLVFCAIALESLLNIDTSNFSSSIVNQISEGVALITANNLTDRKKAKKSVKELYKKRSRIAHGNDDKAVTSAEVELMYNFVKYTIEDLLYNKEFEDVRTIEDLFNVLENKKLSQ